MPTPSGPKSRLRALPGRGVAEDEVEVGFVSGVFGVRGEVRLHLHAREESVLLDGEEWTVVLLAPDQRRYSATLRSRPGAGKRILGRISGSADRDQARELKDWRLLVREADLPVLDDGEFWVRDTIGLPVYQGEVRVGRVSDVTSTGPVDVLHVDTGEEPVFVPLLDGFVEIIDLEEGRVLLRPGAIELEEA